MIAFGLIPEADSVAAKEDKVLGYKVAASLITSVVICAQWSPSDSWFWWLVFWLVWSPLLAFGTYRLIQYTSAGSLSRKVIIGVLVLFAVGMYCLWSDTQQNREFVRQADEKEAAQKAAVRRAQEAELELARQAEVAKQWAEGAKQREADRLGGVVLDRYWRVHLPCREKCKDIISNNPELERQMRDRCTSNCIERSP